MDLAIAAGSRAASALLTSGISFFAKRTKAAMREALRENRWWGLKAEKQVIAELQANGENVVKPEKGWWTERGVRFWDAVKLDENGKVVEGIEVKFNRGRYNKHQRAKDAWTKENRNISTRVIRKFKEEILCNPN